MSSLDRVHIALFALLAGCVNGEDLDDAKDRDDDGYLAFQAGGDDCDDADPDVNPGADEVCGNDVDDDCDTLVDDRGVGEQTWYRDADGDTWGDASVTAVACEAPSGHVGRADDCDDDVATTHPEAVDAWYDGVDANCDGADDYDQDADGHRSKDEATDGDDCDDLDPAVSPSDAEVCGNHVDDDCDGTHNTCDWTGGVLDVRTHRLALGGAIVPRVAVGDADGDGSADLAVWQPDGGAIDLYFGPWSTGDLSTAAVDVTITLPTPTAGYGYVGSLEQDLSGDGRADLVIGGWRPTTLGFVSVFRNLAPTTPDPDSDDAWRTWSGPSDGSTVEDGFGSRVVAVGRTGGATTGVVATPYKVGSTYRCLVFYDAPVSGAADSAADLRIEACEDVVPGLLVTPGSTRILAETDGAYYLIDPTPSVTPVDATAQPEARLWPDSLIGELWRVGADVDGDGSSEVLGFEPFTAEPNVRMPFGPIESGPTASEYFFRLEAGPLIEEFLDLQTPDLNGDGVPEVLVLFDNTSSGDPGADRIGVLFQPIPVLKLTDVAVQSFDASRLLPGSERATSLLTGDVDGDGYTDVILPGPGQIRVFYGYGR